ncbi:MAG: hypothetical protein ACYC6C_10440 [Coriobacteriia bacterium]
MSSKRNRQPKPYRSPDSGFDQQQYPWLNRQFYEGFHGDLPQTRLAMLCLMHDSPSVAKDHFADGVSWDRLSFTLDTTDMTDEKLQHQAEIELVALRQHAAEVLFRIFTVHAAQDPCPWLALGRIRAPGDLKRLVDRYLQGAEWADDESRLAYHARSVWGTSALQENAQVKDDLRAPAANIESWLVVAAHLVREAPLYNAYKHGLAVFAHEPFSLKLSDPHGDTPPLEIEAHAGFKYLDRTTNDAERRHYWSLVNEPVDFYEAASQTMVFSLILEGVLMAGALDRHVTKPPKTLFVLNPELTPDTVRSESAVPVRLQRFCDSMAYLK